MPINIPFKNEPLEERLRVSAQIKQKYPDRLPVIVVPSTDKDPKVAKEKFLCPSEITVGKFLNEVRKHMLMVKPDEAIFMFCILPDGKSVLPGASTIMSQLYERSVDPDGFLYFVYTKESTFGTF